MRNTLKSVATCTVALICLISFQNCGEGFETMNATELSSQLAIFFPSVKWDATPLPLTNNSTHSFAVSLDKPYTGTLQYQCKLDGNLGFSPCLGMFNLSGLTDGVHELSLKAVDLQDSKIESPVLQYSWTQDQTPPALMIMQSPAAVLGQNSAQVVFTSTDAISGVAKVECSLDAIAYATCTSPLMINNLANGAHTLLLKVTDKAGNVSVPTTLNFTVALGLPTVIITNQPTGFIKVRNASVSFSGLDAANKAITKFECRVGNNAFANCTSPMNYANLIDGAYIFQVRGTDDLNRVSGAVSATWMVDATAPLLEISSKPAAMIQVNNASFQFKAADAGSGIKTTTCQLNTLAAEACTTTKAYANLLPGNYVFKLSATDEAGNTSVLEHAFTYTDPTLPPTTNPFSTNRAEFFGASRCANSGLQVCEDFESGAVSNNWSISGALTVEGGQKARGQKALHITRKGNGGAYIMNRNAFPAKNNTYYGRAFYYFVTMPSNPSVTYNHWNIIASNGTSATPGEIRVGGELEQGVNTFASGTDSALGTGDWGFNDTDPNPADPAKKVRGVPLNEWVCIEWMHKGDTNETRFWWDGVEHTSMYTSATKHGGTKGKQYILPTFTNVWVGWTSYQNGPQTYDIWIDEIALNPTRIGCAK